MRRKRRDTEIFSLSFLDVICCGFGAIILLLVLSEFGEPIQIEQSREDLSGLVKKLQQELFEIRGDTEELQREMRGRVDALQRERLNLARVSGDLSRIQGQFEASRQNAAVSNIIEKELLSAFKELESRNVEASAMARARRRLPTEAVGGIPVDSEYVIFLIDTSGSMQTNHWDTATQVMQEILNIYPRLRGVQIVDEIVDRMRDWRAFSDSNPADGIEVAIRNYWSADKRISIYVLGDEFTGESLQRALDAVTRVNRTDEAGRRRVRIHGIGFPFGGGMTPFTNIRFSALMRAMCDQNDGTFVGLTNVQTCAAYVEIFGQRRCVSRDR